MTEQEAKEILLQIAYDGEYPMGSTDAFGMAIKALEKQIPKKPIVTGEFCSYKIYCCPCCREELYEDTEWGNMEFAYCTDCGQKLNWEEV